MSVIAAAAGASGPTWITVAIAALAAVGGVGGIIALLNLPRTRRKMDAETAHVLTSSAIAIVEPLRMQVEALTSRVQRMELRERMHHQVLVDHAVWDDMMLACLREVGMPVSVPPPLYLRDDNFPAG